MNFINKLIGSTAIGLLILLGSLNLGAVDLLTTAATFAAEADEPRTGIEIEFSGITLENTIKIVHRGAGGFVQKEVKTIKTTLSHVGPNGMVFNELQISEWVINSPSIGKIIIKVDTNQVDDVSVLNAEDQVIEIVTSPIKGEQVAQFQKLVDHLKEAGARGTADGFPVSIQYNTEMNHGDVATFNWKYLINLLRVYLSPAHHKQRQLVLRVPEFRLPYVSDYSPGFLKRLENESYDPSPREFYDDFVYRQSLEVLGFSEAWTMTIDQAQTLLLAQKNPIVPKVVKQNSLRISSLLVRAFPEDPMSRLYFESGWVSPYPIIEWREFNNDFQVLLHYGEVIGLMKMVDTFGVFDHDHLMEKLSGVDKKMIKELRQQVWASKSPAVPQWRSDSRAKPVIFRYFNGDRNATQFRDYGELTDAYKPHSVGFLPFFEYGQRPLVIPGESVVMHRNQFHRLSVLGKYNPNLINGFIMQALENKYVEMKFWGDYFKEGIPKTELLSELGIAALSFKNHDGETYDAIKAALKRLNQKFPQGWVLKGLFDLGTERSLLTDESELIESVKKYLKSDFDDFYRQQQEEFAKTPRAEEVFLSILQKHKGYAGWKIVQLFMRPDMVMAQQRYKILKEFRVEVIAGKLLGAGSTLDRYSYLSQKKNGEMKSGYEFPTASELRRVESFAERLIESLPPELQTLTLGLDVALTEDGKLFLVESNPNGNSNFLYEEEIESIRELNQFLEEFPNMVKLGKVHPGLTAEEQMQFLAAKFKEWNVKPEVLYPGMTFLKDRIEDQEFHKRKTGPDRQSCRKVIGR
jgi:hypothetical protein